MLILSLCPQCQTEHELSDKLLGDTVLCQKCSQPFTVEETQRAEDKAITLQSNFADLRPPDDKQEKALPKIKLRLSDGKFSLVSPPPPRELWSNKKKDDDVDALFPEFRPSSKAVKKFLERENVADHSWLLVAGLIASTLLVLAFLGFILYLMVKK